MGKKRTETVIQQQGENKPLPQVEQGINILLGRGEQALDAVPQTPFPGPFIASPDPLQLAARDLASGLALSTPDLGANATNVGNFLTDKVLSGGFTRLPQISDADVAGIQSTLDAITRPTFERLQEQVIPDITSQAILNGAFSGSQATAVLPQIALRDASREVADASRVLAFQDIESQRRALPFLLEQEIQASGLAPSLGAIGFEQALQPINLLETTGALNRADTQASLDDARAAFDEQILAPFRGLPEFASLVGVGTPFGSSTTSGTQTTTQSGGLLGQIFKGLLGGAQLAIGAGGFGPFGGASPTTVSPASGSRFGRF